MQKLIFRSLILLAIACPLVLNAQWAKTYGKAGREQINAVTETADGGFVAVGSTEYLSIFDTWMDALIMKTSPEGDIEWSRSFGGLEQDWADSVFPLADGGVIVAGNYEEINNDLRYAMVLRLDAEGNLEWQSVLWEGGDFNNRVESVEQTADDGFILLGISYHEFVDAPDITVTKLDSAGEVLWNKIFEGTLDDYPSAIQQTADGGYIVAANSRSFSLDEKYSWLMRLDSAGVIIWQKRYTGGAGEWVYDVEQTDDEGFILSGWTSAYGAGETDCWILKIKADGSIEWQRAFGGNRLDSIYSVQQTDEGGCITTGTTTSFGAGKSDGHITKLTALGEVEWQRTFGGDETDVLNDIYQTTEGGFIAAGYTTSFGEGDRDALVICLDSNGNIGSSCSLIGTSFPLETLTTAASEDISIAADNFGQVKEIVDLNPNSPSLVVNTLCLAEKYTLVIGTSVGGTTDPAPGSYIYSEGSEVIIQAVPQNQTWRFDRWTGDVPGGMEMVNPIVIIMDGDKEITALFRRKVLPPQQFTGSRVMNRSLSQREYINVLSWTANPENENITNYRIYLTDGTSQTLLVELNAQTFFYWHRGVEGNRAYAYALTAVNDEGIESEAATTTVQ